MMKFCFSGQRNFGRERVTWRGGWVREWGGGRLAGAHLSLFWRELTSRFMASGLSGILSSHRCSSPGGGIGPLGLLLCLLQLPLELLRRVDALSA